MGPFGDQRRGRATLLSKPVWKGVHGDPPATALMAGTDRSRVGAARAHRLGKKAENTQRDSSSSQMGSLTRGELLRQKVM